MRETFLKYTTDDRVTLSDGTFEDTGIETGWADLVVIAQVHSFLFFHAASYCFTCDGRRSTGVSIMKQRPRNLQGY
jgi:hypothetical protein